MTVGSARRRERLTYPGSPGLIKDLAEIWVNPNGDLFVLFGRDFDHGDAGLQVNRDMDIVSGSDGGVGLD